MNNFDPNGIGFSNGNIFGFPVEENMANIVIIPVPWDATASYKKGTSSGPQSILDASTQLDFYHPILEKAYETKVFLSPISAEWFEINENLSKQSLDYLSALEREGNSAIINFQNVINSINEASHFLNEHLYERCIQLLNESKIPAVLGGEHSVPYGLIKALNSKYESFGILQIDAHADLRDSYESFKYSHASIMFNVLKDLDHVEKLVQVGIRDISENEIQIIKEDQRIETFFDWDLKSNAYNGKSWKEQCEEIVNCLPAYLYISFDIDGLSPELCPNTGTPVPGGLNFNEIQYLFECIYKNNIKIIGFDLNEVAVGNEGDWDANVGARILWQLICLTELTREKK